LSLIYPHVEVTNGTTADAPMLVRHLGMMDIEEIALDSEYLARHVCMILADLVDQKILIRPKKNNTARSRGSQTWRRMDLDYLDGGNTFLDKYNKIRPKAETPFSLLKRTISHWLRRRKKTMQRKRAYTCVIAYNV